MTEEVPPGSRTEYVYLIGVADSQLVKIGRSLDVERRLADIQRMNPAKLTVLWKTEGGPDLEINLHHKFGELRTHGEWFDFAGQDALACVRVAIEELAAVPELPRLRPLTGDWSTAAKSRAATRAANDWTPQREDLGRALYQLRLPSGLSQPQLAEKTGISQPKISRIEAGKQRIRVPEVDAWCRATDASDERRQELLGLAEDALVGPVSWDEAGEESELQRTTGEMEARAGLISVYQPAILPGLLQTASYARRVFSAGPAGEPPNLAEKVLGRLDRQRILYDGSKRL